MMRQILVDFSEFLFGVWALVLVGVELLGEFVVGFFDLFGIGSFGDAECF